MTEAWKLLDPELRRYIDYLQRNLLSEGSEAAHDPTRYMTWISANRGRLIEIASNSGASADLVDEMEAQLAEHKPMSSFDSVVARSIFQPMVDDVLLASEALGMRPQRPVIFANSTDVGPSAAARPSSGEHLLFAGAGTFAFCNYWAKLIAQISVQFHAQFGGLRMTRDRLLKSAAMERGPFVDACRLVLYCGQAGSAIGFGEVVTSVPSNAFRMELLCAMELFVVAHEVGHCFVEERRGPEHPVGPEEELTCDAYALAISRSVGNTRNNWSAFCGAGGVLTLRTTDLCFPHHDGIAPNPLLGPHPVSARRISSLERLVNRFTDSDQVTQSEMYLRELHEIVDVVSYLSEEALRT